MPKYTVRAVREVPACVDPMTDLIGAYRVEAESITVIATGHEALRTADGSMSDRGRLLGVSKAGSAALKALVEAHPATERWCVYFSSRGVNNFVLSGWTEA